MDKKNKFKNQKNCKHLVYVKVEFEDGNLYRCEICDKRSFKRKKHFAYWHYKYIY